MIWNFCIQRPVFTTVIFLVLAIFGFYGLNQMPVQENPDVDFPIVSVNVVLPGAAPRVIESEIIEALESEVNTIEGLRQLTSSARQSVGTVTAEFELWRDIDVAAQDVRDAVERARQDLPDEAEAPIVRKLDLDAQAIMWVALTGDERWTDVRLSDYAENVVKPRLETLRGVGQVQIGGRRYPAVRIHLDPVRLAANRIAVEDVVQTVQANNVDIPSGRIEGVTREFLIQTRGQFSEAAPFNDLIVAYRDGAPVRLADVGEAVDGVEEDRQVARFTGEITAGLGIVKQADANAVALSEVVRERLQEIEDDFPPGLVYNIATDTTEYVEENINDLFTTIGLATVLVVVVVMAFLRSVRGTLVTLLAIPTSLLIAFAVINVLGFTINVLSMLGLILVIGVVVDDAIVVLERAFYHLEKGAEPEPAARVGTTEVAFPVMANSIALAAVFLPIAFTGGMIGRFFLEFGVTVVVAVFASTFVALTLTPMLCSRFLGASQKTGRLVEWSERLFVRTEELYLRLLNVAFRHRGLTLLVAFGAFLLGLLALANVSQEFQPNEDRSSFMLTFETPQGATLAQTNSLAKKIEAILAETPEVSHQFLAIGLAQAGPSQPNRGLAFVKMTPRQERERHQQDVMQSLRERFDRLTEGRVFVSEQAVGGVGGAPVEIVIQHDNLDELARLQEIAMNWMESQPDWYVGVRSDLELNNPQVDVDIDRERATELGISVRDISTALRYLYGEPPISSIERDADRYDVITDVAGRGELVPGSLRDLYIRSGSGDLVPLENLVALTETIGPSQIQRFNRMRSATISAQLPPGVASGDAVARLEAFLNDELPPNADYELAGTSQLMAESFFYLVVAVAFAVVFIYLILAAQFESFTYPVIIMMALPLATVGAFGALWLLDMTLSVIAFIGLIMLLGLVVKNSILLVDFTNVLKARGADTVDAAKTAAHSRFRAVLMTAVSTVLGMLPIAFGFGAGGEARAPLGTAVAGGLAGATFLTLVVIPVTYSLVDDAGRAIKRRVRRVARREANEGGSPR
ncbi:efflux RND transporter permease subunit [Gilvimarinus sp. F26214L]|uniref:efflux RND transporter permease subunit n=1 Tax=Gilvimarinus sp. DZF01 TaxID=3461371 RepID=UPI0040453F40